MNNLTTYFRRIKYSFLRLKRFLAQDMWQLTLDEMSKPKRITVSIAKSVYQSTHQFIADDLIGRASSLTYSTVLSIVPMLAVIVGIAKGFGLQAHVREMLIDTFPGQQSQLDRVFTYVENYLSQVQGGLFIGLGLGILLYTVVTLIGSIEDSFNKIWQAPHSRPWGRRILDYLGLFILMPLILTFSGFLTFLTSAVKSTMLGDVPLLHELLNGAITLLPQLIYILIFIGLYMFLPNVKVRFIPALISGILAGLAFQVFQTLYINGVIWISRYNAIYGSFAAFPLLLLWLQLSWSITLYGAQLSYTIQNLNSFSFGQAVTISSRRYQDFVCLLILRQMLRRMISPERAYSIDEMSRECKIPLRMATHLFTRLEQVGLIVEVVYPEPDNEIYFQPAIAPEVLTIKYVIEKLDRHGTEDFRIDRWRACHPVWLAMLSSRGDDSLPITRSSLIRDL